MHEQTIKRLAGPVPFRGDIQPLAERLGSVGGPDGFVEALAKGGAPPAEGPGLDDRALTDYREGILLALEWPAIVQAHRHVSRGEAKELVALDRQLGQESRWQPWAAASARIGQSHLRCLRPLKDHRVVQRYLNAVEAGQAQGWHPLVYGAVLAVYALPLRQALLHYGEAALQRRASIGAREANLASPAEDRLRRVHFAPLAAALDALLSGIGHGR